MKANIKFSEYVEQVESELIAKGAILRERITRDVHTGALYIEIDRDGLELSYYFTPFWESFSVSDPEYDYHETQCMNAQTGECESLAKFQLPIRQRTPKEYASFYHMLIEQQISFHTNSLIAQNRKS